MTEVRYARGVHSRPVAACQLVAAVGRAVQRQRLRASAPAWPATSTPWKRPEPTDAVADHGIDDIAETYATYIAALPSQPIVIGHSFGGLLAEKLLGELFDKWTTPSPGRPLFQAASANFNPQTKVDTKNEDRGPLLTMGGKDHTVPEAISKSTYKKYRHSEASTELTEFADREEPDVAL
jgi:hypothetical protein